MSSNLTVSAIITMEARAVKGGWLAWKAKRGSNAMGIVLPRLRQNNKNGVNAMEDEDIVVETIEKPSRADRWKRSLAARMRRQVAKFAKAAHSYKEDQEAQARLQAKKLLEKQKKNRRKQTVDI